MANESLDILIRTIAELGGAEKVQSELKKITAQAQKDTASNKAAQAADGPLGILGASGVARFVSAAAVVGGGLKILKDSLSEFSAAEGAVNRLRAFNLGGEETIPTIKHLAELLQTDLAGATNVYIRAANGQTRALKAVGIEVSDTASRTERLREIQEQAAEKGMALLKTRSETLTGQWQNLKKAGGDLLENFGRMVNETGFLQYAMGLVTGPLQFVNSLFEDNADRAKTAAEANREAASATDEAALSAEELGDQLKSQIDLADELAKKRIALATATAALAVEEVKTREAMGVITPETAKAEIERLEIAREAEEIETRLEATQEKRAAIVQTLLELSRQHQKIMEEEVQIRGGGAGPQLGASEIIERMQLTERAKFPATSRFNAADAARLAELNLKFRNSPQAALAQQSKEADDFLSNSQGRLGVISLAMSQFGQMRSNLDSEADLLGIRQATNRQRRKTQDVGAPRGQGRDYFRQYQEFQSGKISLEQFDTSVAGINPGAAEQALRTKVTEAVTQMNRLGLTLADTLNPLVKEVQEINRRLASLRTP